MLFQPRRHGFTKQMPGLGIHVFDPFFLPTPGMLLSMRRHGLKAFMRIGF
jgi:hypothetical protein